MTKTSSTVPTVNRNKKTSPKEKSEFLCEFCRRGFTTDGKLLIHMCEKKRRFQQRDEKPVKLGYLAYQTFWKHSMGKKTDPTYTSFSNSSLYSAFVKFGRHVVEINAVNPMNFIDFLLRTQTPIDKWTSPHLYDTYIRELNRNEAPQDGVDRSVIEMKKWATQRNEEWRDFFRKVETPLVALLIANGRISPWSIFLASSARDLLERFDPEQWALIEPRIETQFWQKKIELHQKAVEEIRKRLEEDGI